MAGKRLAMNDKPDKPKKKKLCWSKILSMVAISYGFIIAQECILLMFYCIRTGYTSTAAWLTAAVGLAEAVIAAGLNGYLSMAKSDHKEGGITYEAAKAKNFEESTDYNVDSPPI